MPLIITIPTARDLYNCGVNMIYTSKHVVMLQTSKHVVMLQTSKHVVHKNDVYTTYDNIIHLPFSMLYNTHTAKSQYIFTYKPMLCIAYPPVFALQYSDTAVYTFLHRPESEGENMYMKLGR